MRIKNEYIEIKTGNKIYRKENMILNNYLKRIFNTQLYDDFPGTRINFCYLKLDTPLENIDYDSVLNGLTDFDVRIWTEYKPTFIATNNTVKLTYKFDGSRISYKPPGSDTSIQLYNYDKLVGRKITAIGFGMSNTCYAVLDTNNMNIIINSGEQFMITRVDNIVSDGISKGIEYPLHLFSTIADKDPKIIQDGNVGYRENTNAKLYSIGFGNTPGYMEEEYLIENVETDRDDYSITFEVNRTKKVGHYPSENLQLGFYPTMDNSKYLIFKYRLYRRYQDGNNQYVVTYLDEYYTMNKPNENFGDLQIKLKIDRM